MRESSWKVGEGTLGCGQAVTLQSEWALALVSLLSMGARAPFAGHLGGGWAEGPVGEAPAAHVRGP